MKANDTNKPRLIAVKMRRWLDIIACPLLDVNTPTWKARVNFKKLVKAYPNVAAEAGLTEADSYPPVRKPSVPVRLTPPVIAGGPPPPVGSLTLDAMILSYGAPSAGTPSPGSTPPTVWREHTPGREVWDDGESMRFRTKPPVPPTWRAYDADWEVCGDAPNRRFRPVVWPRALEDAASQIDTWEDEGGAS